ncbi:MAG: hypothetical protein U9M89_02790 [Patescibacteria group bacterium]|nr:hypothetical protein [Patescibacteria group bacterium]
MKASELNEKAFKALENILIDSKASPALKVKVAQDILDRGGHPKFSAQSIKTTQVTIGGADLKAEREELLAEYDVIAKELRQIGVDDEQVRSRRSRRDKKKK